MGVLVVGVFGGWVVLWFGGWVGEWVILLEQMGDMGGHMGRRLVRESHDRKTEDEWIDGRMW